MKIQYLGTAAAEGIPAVWCGCDVCRKARKAAGREIRTRSQALIDDSLIVDFPPDAYFHMLQGSFDFRNFRNVLFTHSHQDHFYPEEFAMRSAEYAKDLSFPIQVYGNDIVVERLKNTLEISIPDRVIVHEVQEFQETDIDDFKVTPLLADHDPGEKCLIYIIERNGKTLLYANDTGNFPEKTWEFIERQQVRFDMLSMDCTMGADDSRHYHMGIPNILRAKERLLDDHLICEDTPIVATHFSHNHYTDFEGMEAELASYGMVMAYDGMSFEF
jgi:phosphoribosyl 1,2-cyclic phosphate phosphodiesterase